MSNNEIPEGFNMTELGSLPDEWGVVRLGDKGRFQYGYTTSATEKDTGTKFLRITDIKEDGAVNWDTVPYGIIDDENLQKFRLSKGNVLFARIGATTGKTCIIEGAIPNAVFASYLIRFVPNKELHPKYVFYFTQTRDYQKLVDAGKEGKLKKGLSATELKNFIIPLPPLPEQHRIAAVLSAVQDAKEKTEAVIAAAKSLKKSLMRHLFTYGPVPAGAAESVPLAETEIGLVPEGWRVLPIGQVSEIIMGQSPPGRSYNTDGIGISLINGPAEFGESFPRSTKWTVSPTKTCVSGDILFCVRGNTTGRMNVADTEYCIGRGVAAIRGIDGLSETSYLFYFLKKEAGAILTIATAGGSTFPNITKSQLRNFSTPTPPLPTQQKIAHILSTVDKKIEAEENKKKALEGLFKTFLNNLMTAKIRVDDMVI